MTELLTVYRGIPEEIQQNTGEADNNPYSQDRLNALSEVLEMKNKINSDSESTPVLLDPCEINIDLVVKKCEYSSEDEAVCSLGVVMREGVAYCPLQDRRKITIRSTFASKEE